MILFTALQQLMLFIIACHYVFSQSITLQTIDDLSTAALSASPSLAQSLPTLYDTNLYVLSQSATDTTAVVSGYESFLESFAGLTTANAFKSPEEFVYRSFVFQDNLNKISQHNSNPSRLYNMRINAFGDLVENEFKSIFSRLTIPQNIINSRTILLPNGTRTRRLQTLYTVPENVTLNWACRSTPVINQGACGSCYIIAPLESIVITSRMYRSNLSAMSIQEVLSCTPAGNGAFGCNGGYFASSFNYAKVNGVGRAVMYPYDLNATTLATVTPCNTAITTNSLYISSKFKIRDSSFIPFNDCRQLVKRLKTQSLAVSISTSGFQFYVNGTYNGANEAPNHGVTLVGYNPSFGYRIKNSWGVIWGDSGFAWVSETTGVCDYAMYPITGLENQTQLLPSC